MMTAVIPLSSVVKCQCLNVEATEESSSSLLHKKRPQITIFIQIMALMTIYKVKGAANNNNLKRIITQPYSSTQHVNVDFDKMKIFYDN